jgi:hypothetical protein
MPTEKKPFHVSGTLSKALYRPNRQFFANPAENRDILSPFYPQFFRVNFSANLPIIRIMAL